MNNLGAHALLHARQVGPNELHDPKQGRHTVYSLLTRKNSVVSCYNPSACMHGSRKPLLYLFQKVVECELKFNNNNTRTATKNICTTV